MSATSELRLGAVLLAGGASRRFGADNKLLAEVGGQPIVARVAREIVAGGVDELLAQLLALAQPGDHVVFMSNGGFEGAPRRFAQTLG